MKFLNIMLILAFLISSCTRDNENIPELVQSEAELRALSINNAECAFDSTTNTYYYPVSSAAPFTNYTVGFDTTTVQAIMFDAVKVANGATLNVPLRVNQEITIQALDKKHNPTNYNLVITGLPIVILKAEQSIGDERVSAELRLIDPDFKTRNSPLQIQSDIKISVRGATARSYPKKAYSVRLVDEQGEDRDMRVMGLRNDNSWILDAMYVDQARMRNRLCTDIWNSFNNVPYAGSEPEALNGTRGYMTEVFLNNQYWGIYCLTERLDRKQLKIKKDYGKMYKAEEWTDEVQFKSVSAFDNNSPTWKGWEFAHPEIGDDPAPDWSYLYNIINFVSNSSREDFVKQIADKVDLPNMADYYIFMNILDAQDNQSKNTFFSFYDYREKSTFFYSVWDLDATFGRSWSGGYSQFIIGAGNNNLLDRLIVFNPNNFKQMMKDRWNDLKNNQLSKATITDRIENYRKQLVNTNAFAREKARWNNFSQDINSETDYMKSWYSKQWDMLDVYIGNK